MLRQSLKALGVEPLALLDAAGIEPTRRAEEVEIEGFAGLARALARMRRGPDDEESRAPKTN